MVRNSQLRKAESLGDRIVIHKSFDSGSNPHVGSPITAFSGPKDFDKIHCTGALLKALNEIEEIGGTCELHETVANINDKTYFMDIKQANHPAEMPTNDEIEKLQQELDKATDEMAEKYRKRFGDIFAPFGFQPIDQIEAKTCIFAVNFGKKYQNVFTLNEQSINDMIGELNRNVDDLNQQPQQLDRISPSGDVVNNYVTLDDPLARGNAVRNFMENVYMKSTNLINQAYLDGKPFSIEFVTEQMKARIFTFFYLYNQFNWNFFNFFRWRIGACLSIWPTNSEYKHKQLHCYSWSKWFLSSSVSSNIRSTEDYFDCIPERYKQAFGSDHLPISKVYEIVAMQITDIEKIMEKFNFNEEHIHYKTEVLLEMEKKEIKRRRIVKNMMVAEKRKFDARVGAFDAKFQAFLQSFVQVAEFCSVRWNLNLELSCDNSPLWSPISMVVTDPAYDQMATLNHHAAAVALKLAINLSIGSPILIFDSLDYIIEPELIK